MADDIAPELLEKVQSEYRKLRENDAELARISERTAAGTADGKDLDAYAIREGELLAEALHNNVSGDVLPNGKMYFNIADRVLPPVLEEDYAHVADISDRIYQNLNSKAGIHIRAQHPDLDEDRVKGLVNLAATADQYEDIRKQLEGDVVNFSQSVATDSVRKNADFQYKAGLSPKIVRTAAAGCCKWCTDLAGTYDYATVKASGNEVWQRHRGCGCVVEYDPGNGSRQNVHTKQYSWKEDNSEKVDNRINMSMDYPRIERGETKTIEAGGDLSDKIISGKQADFGDYKIAISDKLEIKPRELHEIEKDYIRPAIEKIATDRNKLPTVILADVTELSSAGRYVYDSNSLFLVLKRDGSYEDNRKYNNHLVLHELTHWKDCQEIAKDNPGITEKELAPIYNEISKKALDEAGVDKYNVSKYGSYAKTKYDEGNYCEPYVDYRVFKIMGRWWKDEL